MYWDQLYIEIYEKKKIGVERQTKMSEYLTDEIVRRHSQCQSENGMPHHYQCDPVCARVQTQTDIHTTHQLLWLTLFFCFVFLSRSRALTTRIPFAQCSNVRSHFTHTHTLTNIDTHSDSTQAVARRIATVLTQPNTH